MSIVPGSETTCVRCGAQVVLYMKIQGGKYVRADRPARYDWHCGVDPRYPTRGHKPKTLPGEEAPVYFEYLVKVEAERDEGKFASREDIGGQIESELAGADPGTLEGENGGSYSINSWEVEEVEQKRKS